MKVAVVGSRNLSIENLGEYLPENVSEIISGGAKGIDTCAARYASASNIPFREILPDYEKYGRYAPLKRNLEIIDGADFLVVFWDGKSKGTKFVIDEAKKRGKAVRVILCEKE